MSVRICKGDFVINIRENGSIKSGSKTLYFDSISTAFVLINLFKKILKLKDKGETISYILRMIESTGKEAIHRRRDIKRLVHGFIGKNESEQINNIDINPLHSLTNLKRMERLIRV